ncbi:MAG: LuxR C-terminal-related transcriptional regulator [Candidatus Sulfotelmatobacter sp.]
MKPREQRQPDDRCRPKLFSLEEWLAIMKHLKLSPRQAEVVGLTIQSKKAKQIGATLGISKFTVITNLNICRRKLIASDSMGLFYRVVESYRRLYR